jgi:BMFP domain-containing protein YqiC
MIPLDDLTKKLFAALPENLQNFESNMHQKFKEILQTAFSQLNLVTREEFDVQTKVLARTREKVEQLQKQLDALAIAKKSRS